MAVLRARRVRAWLALSLVVLAVGVALPTPAAADAPPVVVVDPVDQRGSVGEVVTFSSSAAGDPVPDRRWERSSDGGTTWSPVAGAVGEQLSVGPLQAADDGDRFRAVYESTAGSATSAEASLLVHRVPTITLQPTSQVVVAGQLATFSAAADRYDRVQWERRIGSGSYEPIPDATDATFSIIADPSIALHQFRAAFFDGDLRATSSPAGVTVRTAPTIVGAPVDVLRAAGQTATFTVTATGSATLTYQWQRSTDEGATWIDLAGATSASLSLPGIAATSAGPYRVRVTNPWGTALSPAATLSVGAAPTISNPPGDRQGPLGGTITLATNFGGPTGDPTPTLQWQRSDDGGASWADEAGATSASLTMVLTEEHHGRRYRLVATNRYGTATSTVFVLSVGTAPKFTVEPPIGEVHYLLPGEDLRFDVVATGYPAPDIVWRRRSPSGTFTTIEGATGPSYSVPYDPADDGWSFNALATNRMGSDGSNLVTVRTAVAPSITTQPVDLEVTSGRPAAFSAAVAGAPTPTVRWERSVDGGATWTSTSSTILAHPIYDGALVRVVAVNAFGTAVSREAQLTVLPGPEVTVQPVDRAVPRNATAVFTAAAVGAPSPTVQWERSTDGGGTWTPIAGATSSTLSLTATMDDHLHRFRAVFDNGIASVATEEAVLRVGLPTGVVTVLQPYAQIESFGPLRAAYAIDVDATPPVTSITWERVTSQGCATGCIPTVSVATLASGPSASIPAAGGTYLTQHQYRVKLVNEVGVSYVGIPAPISASGPSMSTQPPASRVVGPGGSTTLTAAASGSPPPTVQWQRSGDGGATYIDIAGATATSLALTGLQASDSGARYRARFTNLVGSVTSNATSITVDSTPPALVATPSSSAPVLAGAYGGPVSIALAATDGSGVHSITWQVAGAGAIGPITANGPSTQVAIAAPGTSTLTATARDVHGNESALTTLVVRITQLPGAPTAIRVVPGDGSATLSWTPPAVGAPLAGYRIVPRLDGVPQAPIDVGPDATATVTGLANGSTYSFLVAARNASGTGPDGVSAAQTVGVPVTPPRIWAVSGPSSATVSWLAPSSPVGPVTGYLLTPYVGATPLEPRLVSGSTTAITVTGLEDGVAHSFRVRAVNSVGVGPPAISATIVVGTPPALTGVVASPVDGGAQLRWSAPPVSAQVTGYRVTPYLGTTALAPQEFGPGTSATALGLVNGQTYSLRIAARNAQGLGLEIVVTGVTVGQLPRPVSGARAVAGSGSVTLTWNAPDPAGPAVTGYQITPVRGGAALAPRAFGPGSSATVTGLVDGETLAWRIAAVNGSGVGPVVVLSALVVGAPATPPRLWAVPGDGSATLTWLAPASPTGPITGYRITPYVGSVAQSAIEVGPVLTAVVSGRANGEVTSFRVQARNAAGLGPWAISAAITIGAPAEPGTVRAVALGAGAARLSWSAPASPAGPITGYVVTPVVAGVVGTPIEVGPTTSLDVAGLGAGAGRSFRIVAINAWGSSQMVVSSPIAT